ncbi:MAG TPA: hypothetical protein PKI32_06745 [Opitutales bacterium]|nr:hypothetical protein [Opitutales bacterium]
MSAKYWNLTAALILLAGLALWYAFTDAPGARCGAGTSGGGTTVPVNGTPAADVPDDNAPAPADSVSPAVAELLAAMDESARLLREGGDAPSILAALREKLRAAAPADASAAIARYLAKGDNAATGLPFAVGAGGAFTSLPSLRTWLLSELLELDPKEALRQAEIVFEARLSADEFTVCLRNVGKIDSSDSGRAYVGRRAAELLSDAKLAASPSAGFAEAFDAIVYAGGTSHFALLSSLAEKSRGTALNLPAFMSLDRMAIDDTAASLAALADPALLADRPLTKAGMMARADLADEGERGTVETYVLSLSPESPAADYFFRILPNLNYTLTDGILTEPVQVSHEYVQERAEAALAAVEAWLSDSRFSAHRDQLEAARQRIGTILGR